MLKDKIGKLGVTFDDVLLEPRYSEIVPSEVDVSTRLTRRIALQIPLISSPMDTVTESEMAIALAKEGGLGIVHKNLSIECQTEQVMKVKRSANGIIVDPVTLPPEEKVGRAAELMDQANVSGIPIVHADQKLAGILTRRDLRFLEDPELPVSEVMTHENLVTAVGNVTLEEAERILTAKRVEKLLLVDENRKLTGLITIRDIDMMKRFPRACKDAQGRLRVGAAIGVGGFDRARALIDQGVDLLVVDSAHGHSKNVIETVREIKQQRNWDIEVLAGNVATAEGAESLIAEGADAIKVGIGPGSICTTRVISGIGVPQISAILDTVAVAEKHNLPVIADGGIRFSGDITKALAAGASAVMIGSLFAGLAESPGKVILYQGRTFKSYRGMGSIGAMVEGSSDRYRQSDAEADKLVPEGVEGRVPFKGPLSDYVYQLVGGLRAGMGYIGTRTIQQLRRDARFIRVSAATVRENHPHDIAITQERPTTARTRSTARRTEYPCSPNRHAASRHRSASLILAGLVESRLRGIPTPVVLFAMLFASTGAAIPAQSPRPTALRPVPKFGSQLDRPTGTAAVTSEGWNLQWRASRQRSVSPQSVSPQGVFESRPAAVATAIRRPVSPALRPVTEPPQLRPVRTVAWQAPDASKEAGEILIPPPDESTQPPQRPDFFDDPFGDDPVDPNLFDSPAVAAPAAPRGEQLIRPPAGTVDTDLPAPANQLRSEGEPRQSPSQNRLDPIQETIPTPPAKPERSAPPPAELPSPRAAGSDRDARGADRGDARPAENPFGRRDLDDQAAEDDELDRMELEDFLDEDAEVQDARNKLNLVEPDIPGTIDCDDIRRRIAAQTIDQVSLDISPPYRPDEIDIERYSELKADFDEKQPIRAWRRIDGSVMASGQLRDLAYEQAVIVTDQGELEELPIDRLSEADLAYIAEAWGLPVECLLERSAPAPRSWVMTTMTWKASNLCHSPLYFQDVNLERYGHTHGPLLEPLVQSAHFFGNVLVLPYKMGIHGPHECIYPLGYYRPGNCAPWIQQPVPISAKGAITQAVTTAGLFWLIP